MRRLCSVALLLLGCTRTPPASAPEAAEPPPVPSAPPPQPASVEKPGADRVVAEALALVERRRELRAKGPVKGRTIGRAEMVAYVKKQLAEEIPAPILRAQSEMLFALGVVPEAFDYEKSLLELMGSQLAGFYDPKRKSMSLAEDLPPVERDATLAHELVHALQDQHYDLEKRIKFREDATDEQSAIHALAEGDATSAMIDHVLAVRGLRATDVSDEVISLQARGAMELSMEAANVPTILKRSVVSPYVDGLMLVNWARRQSGWAGVDSIWRDPPTTTEQLLHPEKLVAREKAETLPIPTAPPKGPGEVSYRDVLGEQSLRILFEEWMPRRAAVESARAWAGDRIALFRSGERFALAWHVRYDDEGAAKRGLEAFVRGVVRDPRASAAEFVSVEKAKAAAKPGKSCRERSSNGPFAVVRSGRDLALVAGPFERSPAGARSAGTCADALVWAAGVAKQR